MSDKEETVDTNQAIEMAMNRVRAKGLSEEHFDSLFSGERVITNREALIIAHIQHLEAKVFALSSIMEEIASMKGAASIIAQSTLENLVKPRKIKESK